MTKRMGIGLWPLCPRWLPLFAVLSTGCSVIVDTDSDQCKATSDCVSKGGPFGQSVCRNNVCVPLLTKDCIYVEPQGRPIKDDTLVMGFMSPIVGEYASNGIPQWEGVRFALDQIYAGSNGLPLPDGSTRDIVVVGCHDFDDSVGVAKHLANEVKVPAILGPAFSGDTMKVATEVTVPAGVLLFPSSATAAAITNLNDKGLVWRTCPSDAIQAVPLAGLVKDMETKVRVDQSIPTAPIRVVIAVKGDTYGLGLADAVIPLVSINGTVTRKDYPDPAEDTTYDFLPLVNEIVGLQPHIVVAIGTNESITKVMGGFPETTGIEDNWPTGATAPPRPIYLFADGGRLQELIDATATNADLRARVLGTAPGRKTANYAFWATNFTAFIKEPPLTYADTAYDSAFLLAFAIGALGNTPVTGAGLAESLKKTVGGATKVVPGSTGLNDAFTKLFAGEAIDYDGISGPLDFDVNTGEAPADIDIWCIKPGGGEIIASGAYYDAVQKSVVGKRTACETGLNSP